MSSVIALRRPSFTARVTRWARRHRVQVRLLVVLVGVVGSWACKYASSGPALALCELGQLLAGKVAPLLEQLLHAKGAAG